MTELKLKKCPFCGTKRWLEYCTTNEYAHWIRCNKCGCEGPHNSNVYDLQEGSKEQAISAWNRREK